MLIQKKNVVAKAKLSVNISKEVEQDLVQYMEFIGEEDKNYIVEEALKIVFKKDKEFDKWKKAKATQNNLEAAAE